MDISFIFKHHIKKIFSRKGDYLKATEHCGNENRVVDAEVPVLDRDWTVQVTTEDQLRIEEYLSLKNMQEKNILHIGVGNSSLALKFSDLSLKIDGVTIASEEKEYAESLALKNYKVFILNKYSKELLRLETKYDYIVDNNPASWCCCQYHLQLLFKCYADLLVENGEIVTDRMGLDWNTQDKNFRLSYDEYASIGSQYGLSASRENDFTYILRK